VVVAEAFPLAEAAPAHRAIVGAHAAGKRVLVAEVEATLPVLAWIPGGASHRRE
jgi:hypothetical protein